MTTGMKEDFVDIVPIGLTRGMKFEDVFILILKEKDGNRCIPVLIDKETFVMLRSVFRGNKPKNNLAKEIASVFDIKLDYVILHQPPTGGSMVSTLILCQNGITTKTLETDLATGVTASLSEDVPLRLPEIVFSRLANRQTGTEGQVSFPISSMTDKLLGDALQMAVKEDNFELASLLRDEIARRKDLHLESSN
ncbi:hypothetical protein C7Y71_001275 [Pseudoprevotella muciniphila]|uniref:BFN domain-containing protein n=2 Tax=Pseudoprevotella muciniphila TaxID=2133944 RepID=A0A5P8E4B4_9BACT|nr:hypothetical protein C7Y71_001275 [Pseudoprevotella muciniphila]